MPTAEKKCPIKPVHDIVVVVPDKAPDKHGELFLPPSAQKTAGCLLGTVVAVGSGKWSEETGRFIPVAVDVGQRVWYGQYAGNEVGIGEYKYTFLRDADILGVEV